MGLFLQVDPTWLLTIVPLLLLSMFGETNTSMISIEVEGFFQFPMYHKRRLVLAIIFTDKKRRYLWINNETCSGIWLSAASYYIYVMPWFISFFYCKRTVILFYFSPKIILACKLCKKYETALYFLIHTSFCLLQRRWNWRHSKGITSYSR